MKYEEEAVRARNADMTGEAVDELTETQILGLIDMRCKKGFELDFDSLVALLYQKRATALEKRSVELAGKVTNLTCWVTGLTAAVLIGTLVQVVLIATGR